MKITKKRIEKLVSKAYDKTALQYTKVFRKNPNYMIVLNKIYKKIPKDSKVLDVGSGVGVPVSRFLSKRFDVTGIDISNKMIQLSRKNVPKAKFKKMSMMHLKFKPETFSLVCSFFSLFHIKKSEIPKILKKFHKILKKKGYLVLALGESKEDKEHFSSFFGEKMYYSATPRQKIRKILINSGFKIIFFKYLYFRYVREKERIEKELFVIAQKRNIK